MAFVVLPWTLLLLWVSGCTAPIGANQAGLQTVYKKASANGLSGQVSGRSQMVLHRYGLDASYKKEPAETLRRLHETACTDDRRDLLFALSDLSYHYADRLESSPKRWEPKQARDYYLSAAIYAYLYLLGPARDPAPTSFDRRFRMACDLYNGGLARGLGSRVRTNAVVVLDGGARQLPAGRVEIQLETNAFPWDLSGFDRFLSADQFLVRGLSTRDRQSGMGAPLIGVLKQGGQGSTARRVPATAFLRVPGDIHTWTAGELKPTLELYSGYGVDTVQIEGQTIPLETDLTAPLAHSLNDAFLWQLGMGQFFSSVERIKSDVYLTQPYERGRVPVVFVHGTFSSPVWWAEMINTLRSDPEIREHCQLWFFIYNSGNPVPFSANKLRECLTAKVKELDPSGSDPALQQMVVIGHSQGGLLTKLTATDTGDKLLQVTGLGGAKLTDKERELLRRYTVYEALPFVKRVVFISTPHRGSYLAGGFVRNLARRFIRFPRHMIERASEWAGLQEKLKLKGIPTSLDSMSPDNKYLLTLANIPLAPGVKGHSIIAVQGNGDYKLGKDGLVMYSSAHVDYVESEFIVRSFHSCQDKAETIEEVRRILLEHLSELEAGKSAQRKPEGK